MEAAQRQNKSIIKCIRKEKRRHICSTIERQLDTRKIWKGIKCVKKDYAAKCYGIRKSNGEAIQQSEVAKETALHLSQEQWGVDGNQKRTHRPRHLGKAQIKQ